MYNITVVVEKNDEEGFMKKDSIRLVEVGGQIAHTLTPRHGDINVQHCNLIIEFRELKTMNYTEVKMVAMRGRNPENPSDRRAGIDLEQILEINDSNVVNSLTTVQKDNLVLEEKAIKIRQADKQGYALCEIGGAADLNYATSQTRRGRVIENGKICPTLTTENIPNVIELGNEKFYNFIYKIGDEWWLIRIRKLTPRECWRLMGFYDEDFDKAEKVNSNTQLYKQAGNSIVVNVLEEIFKQMIGD